MGGWVGGFYLVHVESSLCEEEEVLGIAAVV